jgi:hypothetical protein
MGVDIIFMWLAELFDQQFVNLLLATGLLFLVMFVTWWVYKKLSTRNIFHLFRSPRHPAPGFWDYAVYAMKYFLLFPALTFCGFLIFALSLFLLMRPATLEAQSNVLFIAIVIVNTIRVSAYVHEALAEDLAKLVPLSLLAVLLATPNKLAGMTGDRFVEFVRLIPGVLKYLFFIVVLEMLLRGGAWLFSRLDDARIVSPKE